jgi:hypothetical protein
LQADLLRLAQRQGLLYAHQLPPRHNERADAPNLGSLLTPLLNGNVQHLEPLRPQALPVHDSALDPTQRDAVAKALATPDVCLLQGLPGTGKSRVVAEIIVQAAVRGDRVLLLAESTAALDRVLELVHGHEAICALRVLAPGEQPSALSPSTRSLLLDERARHLRAASLSNARKSLTETDQRRLRLRQDEPAWNHLKELATRLDQLQHELAAISARRLQLLNQVEQEAAAAADGSLSSGAERYLVDLANCIRRHREAYGVVDESRATLRAQIERIGAEQQRVQCRIDPLLPLAAARQLRRWWTGAYWRALFRKSLFADLKVLEDQLRELQTLLADLEEESRNLIQKQEDLAGQLAAERAQCLASEASRRQMELDNQFAACRQEGDFLRKKWLTASATLHPEGPRPVDCTAAAVNEGCDLWRRQLHVEERQAALLQRWIPCLEEVNAWPARLRRYANVVAATALGLAADAHFGDAAAAQPQFDLVIWQEADRLAEADLHALASRARRFVLVGEPAIEYDHGKMVDRPHAVRKSRSLSERVAIFEKLWRQLHWEPRSLPYAWVQEGNRLCCRLKPIAPDQRHRLETESVADFPDIELRILTVPNAQPVLAEIVFPPAVSIAEAKTYVFKELEELAVQTSGHSACWTEQAERLVLGFASYVLHPVSVALESGVRELVGEPTQDGSDRVSNWLTCCIEFDRAAGWDRTRAEAWVQQYLGRRELGRTVRLDVPHRMQPPLAAFLSSLLFDGDYQHASVCRVDAAHHQHSVGETAVDANGSGPCVEFVPVPPLRDRHESPKGAATSSVQGRPGPSSLPRKGGAGLEVDLADPRQRARLPGSLAAQLPGRGFVNYAEAQAIVRALENLAANPDCWPLHDRSDPPPARPLVAVMALYPAQVELIRLLVQQSAALKPLAADIDIAAPAAFREREFSIVLLSLTRSHSHRAITFGDGPDVLTLALTRARARLILFGDPGSLARRSQWDGPLDHLDDQAAARERDCITHLVHYLQGQGPHPGAFRLREGVGT